MKTPVVVGLLLFLGVNVSQAFVVFKKSSNLPQEMQTYLSRVIEQRCPRRVTVKFDAAESGTDVRYDALSNVYTTEFTLFKTPVSENEAAVELGSVTIESVQYKAEPTAGRIETQSIRGLCR